MPYYRMSGILKLNILEQYKHFKSRHYIIINVFNDLKIENFVS